MAKHFIRIVGVLLGVAAIRVGASAAPVTDPPDLKPAAVVAGKSQGEWSVRWWQWAASFDYGDSPVADLTGERCGAGQEGDVWFLAGAYESTAVARRCRVPAGKYIFFPLINYVVSERECDRCTCESATLLAKRMTDEPMALVAELDGKEITNLRARRVVSPTCFDLAGRTKDHSGPRIYPTASDGYWVMLKPLAPGRHELRLGGSLPSLRQDVTYHLEVNRAVGR